MKEIVKEKERERHPSIYRIMLKKGHRLTIKRKGISQPRTGTTINKGKDKKE